MKKHLLTILSIGIPLGIVLLIIRRTVDIPDSQFWRYYITIAIITIIIVAVVNIIWQISFIKKLTKLTPLLYKDPDKYIEENKKHLQKAKSVYNKCLLVMNISVGYSEKHDYKRAMEVLLKIPEKNMKGINNIIYHHNLCYYHFMLGENEEGCRIFNSYINEFVKFGDHPAFGGGITINKIYYLLSEGNKEQAKLLFDKAKEEYTDSKYQNDFKVLAEKF